MADSEPQCLGDGGKGHLLERSPYDFYKRLEGVHLLKEMTFGCTSAEER